jgi:hypothetical protein
MITDTSRRYAHEIVRDHGHDWYAHLVTIPVLGDGKAGPWFRVVSLTARRPTGSAEQDFVSILPAALAASGNGRPFVAGWLSRGAGSPLELITNAAAEQGAADRPPGERVAAAVRRVDGQTRLPVGREVNPATSWRRCSGRT